MNLHYIDFMIKERRRGELEECERRRLLNTAGYSQPTLIHEVSSSLFNTIHHLIKQRSFGHRRLQPFSQMPKIAAWKEGEGQ